jgi:hypothetical protein
MSLVPTIQRVIKVNAKRVLLMTRVNFTYNLVIHYTGCLRNHLQSSLIIFNNPVHVRLSSFVSLLTLTYYLCPGVDSASKNEYQEFFLGVKTAGSYGWRPYHLNRAECRDDPGALTSWNPKSHIRLVAENLYLLLLPMSSKWFLPFGVPHQSPVCISLLPHSCHIAPRSPSFDHQINIWWGVQVIKIHIR